MIPVRVGRLVAVLAIAGLLVGAFGGVAAADPDAGCIGTERGTPFETDGGFTVWYNDSEPMPESGPFVDDQTLRFRNVTLSSAGATELVLEDGTGPETCLGGIDAGAAPIVIDPDGEQAVRVGGQVRALSIADAQYGDGATDLAYDATGDWTIVVADTGFGQGTTIEAVDASGGTLANGTVDGSGAVRLALPAGTNDVALREESGSQSDGGTGGGSDGGSDGSGDDTTDSGGSTTESGSDGGTTSGSDGGGSDGSGGDSDGSDSGPPWLLIGGGLLAVLVAGGVGYVLNSDGSSGDADTATAAGHDPEAKSGAGSNAAAETDAESDEAAESEVEAAGGDAGAPSAAANDDGSSGVEDANSGDEPETVDPRDQEEHGVANEDAGGQAQETDGSPEE